ncbi:hypothetical protein [Bacillus sp. AG4(2022)]|uniref:hypothetical protein n=1 Tax=Bacillus sp. AG4(2022) TaxID=2962594 RepID=UPI002881077A|nr:hypothetical protein [Bacillus sp. AG4(2022)]MDT0160383.1 hypothetical protein [Bacillus sp. AG4(2022)]
MTGYYVLAAVDGNMICAMHNKIYLTEGMARGALKLLCRFNKRKYETYEVWGISDLTRLKQRK